MFRHLSLALVLLASTAVAFAAPAKGKIISVKDKAIVVKFDGEAPTWMKKGQAVRINQKLNGKIAGVEGAEVTLNSPKASELKAGEAITFDKSLAAAGC
jgi:ribosome maturation factor RimP